MGTPLLEREDELGRIDDALGAARGGSGRVLALVGPAGIGKTALLRELADRAWASGTGVLFARGGELEQDFAFGVVRQLFEPRLAGCSEQVRPLSIGDHFIEASLVLSDEHCAGFSTDPEVNCLPAGETLFFPHPVTVTTPEH